MHSNFAAARLFLERAFVALRGDDVFSFNAREALGLMIEACARTEAHGSSPHVPVPPADALAEASDSASGERAAADTSNVERFPTNREL